MSAVRRAYNRGRLALLVDALDEAPDSGVKDQVLHILTHLAADSGEDGGKRELNRFYLTARYSERDRVSGFRDETGGVVFKPEFCVRSLDMEQLRDMARHFYRREPELYTLFDDVVWREEIAAKVGGTPLTALLVIAYFEIFKTFDSRFHMYNVLLVFILARAWKEIKEGEFRRDLKSFFNEAKSAAFMEETGNRDAAVIYDALGLLSFDYTDMGHDIKENDILGVFEGFSRDGSRRDTKAKEKAEVWLERLREDHLLVRAGVGRYVFIHKTVMEYLAARYVVKTLEDPRYLEGVGPGEAIDVRVKEKTPAFFEGESLPIAVGSGIGTGAGVLGILERLVEARDGTDETDPLTAALRVTAMKGLAEFESIAERKYRMMSLKYLHRGMERDIEANRREWEWIYIYLRELLLSEDKERLRAALTAYRGAARLSLDRLLRDFLDEDADAFITGDSELLADRRALLAVLVKDEPVERWLKEKEKTAVNLLQLDVSVESMDAPHHPEDKNFNYYKGLVGPSLQGFLGSPNLKHGGAVNSIAVSRDGRYIVSGSDDYTLKLWDTVSGKEIRTFKGHEDTIWSVAFSPDGRHVISGSSDFTIKIWDNSSTQCIETITLPWLPRHISPHPTKPGHFAAANTNGTVTFFEWGRQWGSGAVTQSVEV